MARRFLLEIPAERSEIHQSLLRGLDCIDIEATGIKTQNEFDWLAGITDSLVNYLKMEGWVLTNYGLAFKAVSRCWWKINLLSNDEFDDDDPELAIQDHICVLWWNRDSQLFQPVGWVSHIDETRQLFVEVSKLLNPFQSVLPPLAGSSTLSDTTDQAH